MLTAILAEQFGGEYLATSYDDIINPKPKDDSDALEYAEGILTRMGFEVIK